ncbi:hypothetical protein BJ508DRAFT_136429 [Ascobolus immersus RN42]|uniref:Uncharacterized protein n=1 Tax=Ascobolus immersus RN42 TaxID=1160509 RepID=A0A3N4IYA2_ASCIM|nr:hypothetical protein BJ508DRAFT_136429 [Ascobolus immersus RN42]
MTSFSDLPLELRLAIGKQIPDWFDFINYRQLDSTNYALFSTPASEWHLRDVQFHIHYCDQGTVENFAQVLQIKRPDSSKLANQIITDVITTLESRSPEITRNFGNWQLFTLPSVTGDIDTLLEGLTWVDWAPSTRSISTEAFDNLTFTQWLRARSVLSMLEAIGAEGPEDESKEALKLRDELVPYACTNLVSWYIQDFEEHQCAEVHPEFGPAMADFFDEFIPFAMTNSIRKRILSSAICRNVLPILTEGIFVELVTKLRKKEDVTPEELDAVAKMLMGAKIVFRQFKAMI